MSYRNLFTQGQIGSLTLRNRVVFPAMATRMAESDYTVGKRLREYHALRAKHGCGLNITEFVAIHESTHFSCTPALYDDKFILGFQELADSIHQYGGRLCVQLWHAGRQTNREQTGFDPVGPSPIALAPGWPVPKELSREEISELVVCFGKAAARAKQAGADAVEVHGAHGYLIGQFVSGWSNSRTDEYGGTLENRMRFPTEIIQEVRRQVGNDFPIIYRMSAEERVGSLEAVTSQQAVDIAKFAEAAGADAIHVSIGTYGDMWDMIPPIQQPPGFNVHNAEVVKEAVKVPVIAVGRINDPALAEDILIKGKADFVSMGRAQLADPAFVEKARDGRAEDIVKCIGCNQGCIGRYGKSPNGAHLTCMQNPVCGHEFLYKEKPTQQPKRVLVAGGGIAGLTAARILKRRGHQVTLYEAQPECGGEFLLAGIPPGKREISDSVLWLINQAKIENVDIRTSTPVTGTLLRDEKPDSLLLAVGAVPTIPPIPNVERAILARDVLTGKIHVGRRVVVIGGGLVGVETAEYLTSLGKDVTIVEMLSTLAPSADSYKQHYIAEYIREQQIPVYLEATCLSIGDGVVDIRDKDGKTIRLNQDSVVLAAGYRTQQTLMKEAKDMGIQVYAIGDAKEPRLAIDAIKEGFELGNQL